MMNLDASIKKKYNDEDYGEYCWSNEIYSFSDKDDVFVNAICFDASHIEYKNIKAKSQDICCISKKPIKPNTDVWRCSKCGCVASLTNNGILEHIKKCQKRSIKCACPKKCGNHIYREDGMFKHTYHINARFVNERLECPVSLSMDKPYDSTKTKIVIPEIDTGKCDYNYTYSDNMYNNMLDAKYHGMITSHLRCPPQTTSHEPRPTSVATVSS